MNDEVSAKEKAERRLRNACFEKGLSERDTEMCVDYFIKRLSHKEVADKWNIEVQTSLNKKSKFKRSIF